jgi:hypothetical protein
MFPQDNILIKINNNYNLIKNNKTLSIIKNLENHLTVDNKHFANKKIKEPILITQK